MVSAHRQVGKQAGIVPINGWAPILWRSFISARAVLFGFPQSVDILFENVAKLRGSGPLSCPFVGSPGQQEVMEFMAIGRITRLRTLLFPMISLGQVNSKSMNYNRIYKVRGNPLYFSYFPVMQAIPVILTLYLQSALHSMFALIFPCLLGPASFSISSLFKSLQVSVSLRESREVSSILQLKSPQASSSLHKSR